MEFWGGGRRGAGGTGQKLAAATCPVSLFVPLHLVSLGCCPWEFRCPLGGPSLWLMPHPDCWKVLQIQRRPWAPKQQRCLEGFPSLISYLLAQLGTVVVVNFGAPEEGERRSSWAGPEHRLSHWDEYPASFPSWGWMTACLTLCIIARGK